MPESPFFRILNTMEVHFTPEAEKKLQDLAADSGGGSADELVQHVVEGYFEELAQTREMLNSRFDDLKSGTVKPVSGDEVVAYFRQFMRRRRSPCWSLQSYTDGVVLA